jgi:hypothetical protein
MDPALIPLRDLHLPDAVGWWPLAPGWWLLVAVLLVALAYGLHAAYRRWRHNAPRRYALRELKRVRSEYDRGIDSVTLGKELSELLRRAMLAYAPRNEVAGLTGETWLEWLDRGLDDRPFTKGAGRILESLPYLGSDQENRAVDIDELTDVVRRRLRSPLAEGTS